MGFSRGPKIVTDGLVLYLDAANQKSYPGSGTTWSDVSGNGNHGTLINGPTFDGGNAGGIAFDGVDDLIGVPYTNDFDHFKLNNFTIETWVKSTSVIYPMSRHPLKLGHTVFSSSTPGWSAGHGASSTYTQIRVADGTNFSTTDITHPRILESTYYHRIFTIDRSLGCTTSLYMNGKYIGQDVGSNVTGSIYSEIGGETSGFLFGNVWGWKYAGNFNMLKVYNRALNVTEILQNYNATKSRFNL